MDNGNNFFKKNWLTLILIALLGGVSIMWIKDMNETKAKEEAAVEKADSGAVASQEAVDSLAGTMAKEDSIPQETADPLKDEPVVRLRPSLIKGPACMVANTFESYYPRNVIDGNRATAWGLESYQGSVSALVPDGYESHHDYFDAFFAIGDYLQFIQPASKGAQQAGDVVKMKKDYKVGLLVQVNLSALRKRLEKDGITKGVRSLFKF